MDNQSETKTTQMPASKKRGSFVKPFVAGLAGGVIALSGGVGYLAATGGLGSMTSVGGATITKSSGAVNTDTTAAVKGVSNAVVSVLNYQKGSSSSLFSSNSSSTAQLTSEGSGVIYKKTGNEAYIVTNNHVISGESSLEVLLAGGQKISATVVGSDSFSDLAVLKIDAKYVKQVAVWGDSSKLQVGEPAIAVGSPLGSTFANTATEGIISALNRPVNLTNESNQPVSTPNAIQTDAAINPGNSGGALVNIKGQVIGITSSKLTTTEDGSTNVEGMGFAIPSDDVVTLIAKLEKGQKIERPALGITMAALTSLPQSTVDGLNLPSSVTSGVVIGSATSGFPAANAGLKGNDVITKVGDTSVSNGTDLQTALYKYSVGDTVKVTYYRGGSQHTASVKLSKSTDQLSSSN
ncbi:MAG: trypsin-like peptidase domain-containing protein [Streptococcaceae bacterium]|nr:trypsin-like peptidase domain-containing protein [Streptococcaceae bacterium]